MRCLCSDGRLAFAIADGACKYRRGGVASAEGYNDELAATAASVSADSPSDGSAAGATADSSKTGTSDDEALGAASAGAQEDNAASGAQKVTTSPTTLKDNRTKRAARAVQDAAEQTLEAQGEDYTVTVHVPEEAAIPEGAQLNVTEIAPGDDGYKDYLQTMEQKAYGSDKLALPYARLFDISILAEGEEIEPAATADVNISLEDGSVEASGVEFSGVHFGDEGAHEFDVSLDGKGRLGFEADAFSVYGVFYTYSVDFYYGDAEYSIIGGNSVALSKVLKKLKLGYGVEQVEDVVFTDASLLKIATDEDGADWTLASLAPFSSSELLTLYFDDGSAITLEVMDAFTGAEGVCGSVRWAIDEDCTMTLSPAEGETGTLDEIETAADAPWHAYRNKIAEVVVEPGVAAGVKALYLFSGCTNLTAVDLTGLDTSGTENLGYLFNGCTSLVKADVSMLDFSSAISLGYLFNGCINLTDSVFGAIDAPNATNLTYMFSGCTSLANVTWTVAKAGAASTAYMFNGCTGLTDVDLSAWNLENVTSMAYMFQNCTGLTSANLANLHSPKVTSLAYMFNGCSKLASVDVEGWNLSEANTAANYMFSGCSKLASFDLGAISATLTNLQLMFYNCASLTNMDLHEADMGKVTSLNQTFRGCTKLEAVNMHGVQLSANTTFANMFQACAALEDVDLGEVTAPAASTMASMFTGCAKLQQVDLGSSTFAKVSTVSKMFENCSSLASVNLGSLNMPWLTNISYMFTGCAKLQSVDLSSFAPRNSASISLSYMFNGCAALSDVIFSSERGAAFGAAAVRLNNMSYMFNNCKSLEHIDLSVLRSGYLVNVSYLFSGCTSLKDVTLAGVGDAPTFSLAAATNMSYMFNGCTSLESVDTTGLNTVKNTNASYMFNGCSALRSVNLAGLKTNVVTTMTYMFNGCANLESLDLSGFNTAKVTNMNYMLRGCSNLKQLTLGGSFSFKSKDIGIVDGVWDETGTEEEESAATAELVSNSPAGTWVYIGAAYRAVLYADGELVFQSTSAVEENREVVGTYQLYNGATIPGWVSHAQDIVKVTFAGKIAPTSTYQWFYGCSGLESSAIHGIEKLDTSAVTNMGYMFSGCTALNTLDLSGFDTSNVNFMYYMFNGCASLRALDLSGFDTSANTSMSNMFKGCAALESVAFGQEADTAKVTSMAYLFSGCAALANLDLSSFDTTAVTTMAYMFDGCAALDNLDLSSFNTASVTTMTYMFNGCKALESIALSKNFTGTKTTSTAFMFTDCSVLDNLDLSGFASTAALTNMSNMFQRCTALTSLDLSKFVTSKVTNMSYMFSGCNSMKQVDVSTWNTAAVTNMAYLFNSCKALETLDINSFRGNAATNMSYMFNNCTSLAELSASALTAPKATNVASMFNGCSSLRELDLAAFATVATDMISMFNGMTALEALSVPSLNTTKATKFANVLNCPALAKLTIGPNFKFSSNVTALPYGNWTQLEEVQDDNGATQTVYTDTVYRSPVLTTAGNIPGTYAFSVAINVFLYEDGEMVFTADEQPAAGKELLDSYLILPGAVAPAWYADRAAITSVTFEEGIEDAAPSSLYQWFSGCANLVTVRGEEHLNTSAATTMAQMFDGCTSLKKLDVSDWNSSNVTDMSYMFRNCTALETLVLSDEDGYLDTAKVTTMVSMFQNCKTLTNLDVTDLDTANATSMLCMFAGCSGIEALDVSGFFTAKATNLKQVFDGCTGLTELKMGSAKRWNTTKATDMSYMFRNCSKLDTLDVSGFNIKNATTLAYMFAGCAKLAALDVSGFNTRKVTNLQDTFYNCASLETLDVSAWNTATVTNLAYTFENCKALTELDVSAWNTSKVTNMRETFASCSELPIENIGVENWNTSKVTNMYATFFADTTMKTLDVSAWDTGAVTTMYCLFENCENLERINLSSWNTANVTNMAWLFDGCAKLVDFGDISQWNTSKVTTLRGFFNDCSSLTEANVSGWNTGAATNLGYLFSNCASLVKLDLSNFDTSKAEYMDYMFANMTALEELDISNFDTTKVSTLTNFFGNDDVPSLEKISVGEKTNFKYTSLLGTSFPRGTWNKLDADGNETGEQYGSGTLSELMLTGQAAGTYVKYSQHSLQAEFPVTYYIDTLTGVDGISYTGDSFSVTQYWNETQAVPSQAQASVAAADDEEPVGTGEPETVTVEKSKTTTYKNPEELFAFATHADGTSVLYVKMDALEQQDITKIEIDGGVTLLFKDKAIDAEGNKYDFTMTIDDIHYYDFLNGEDGAAKKVTSYEDGYMYLMTFDKDGSRLANYFATDTEGEEISLVYTSSAQQITMKVIDSNGEAVDGSFLFSIYDLDIASYKDLVEYGELADEDGNVRAKTSAQDYRRFLYYSEGVYLGEGFSPDTITCDEHNQLYDIGNAEDAPFDGYRITGTRLDSRSELLEFVVKANASGASFIWTAGGHAGTDFLSMYQPTSFEVEKVDQDEKTLPGAKLSLYQTKRYDGTELAQRELVSTWTSRSDVAKKAFLVPGYYDLVEEEAPGGYFKADDVHVFIDYDYNVWQLGTDESGAETRTKVVDDSGNAVPLLKMTDWAAYGKLDIGKLVAGSNVPLEGAGFTLKGTSVAFGEYGKTATTGADGLASFGDIPVGTYTLSETTVPLGYAKASDKTVEVRMSGDGSSVETVIDGKILGSDERLSIYDDKVNAVGKLNIDKRSASTGEALAGAVFTLTSAEGVDSALTYSATTDDNGKASFDGLKVGSYTLQETMQPVGYLASDISWQVEITEELGNPEAIVSVTASDGSAVSFTRADAETGAVANVLTVENTEGVIKVRKVNPWTGAVLAGAEFVLTDADGQYLQVGTRGKNWAEEQSDATVFTSDAEGYFEIPAGLPVGNYRLLEIAAPKNYSSIGYTYTISISADAAPALVVESGFEGLEGPLAQYNPNVRIGDLTKYAVGGDTKLYVLDLDGDPYPAGGAFKLYLTATGAPLTATLGEDGELILDSKHVQGYNGTSEVYALTETDCPWVIYAAQPGYGIVGGAEEGIFDLVGNGAVLGGYVEQWDFDFALATDMDQDIYLNPNDPQDMHIGTVDVKKVLSKNGLTSGDMVGKTFKVALFSKPSGKQQYQVGEAKKITFSEADVAAGYASASFSDLLPGKYYVYELDDDSNAITGGQASISGEKYIVKYENNSPAVIKKGQLEQEATVSNYWVKPAKTVTVGDDAANIDGKTVLPGTELTYRITYTNPFDHAVTATITDAIPAHTTYVEGSADFDAEYADGMLTWNVNVESGQTVTVSFKVVVDEGASGFKLENRAEVNDGENSYTTNKVSNFVPAHDDPPVLKTVAGDAPETESNFTFQIEAKETTADVDKLPMPNKADAKTCTVDAKPGVATEFGVIEFTKKGTYTYEVSEVNTGIEGYTYDTTVYTLFYEVTEDENGHLEAVRHILKDGAEVDNAQFGFTNTYSRPETPGPDQPVEDPETPGSDQPSDDPVTPDPDQPLEDPETPGTAESPETPAGSEDAPSTEVESTDITDDSTPGTAAAGDEDADDTTLGDDATPTSKASGSKSGNGSGSDMVIDDSDTPTSAVDTGDRFMGLTVMLLVIACALGGAALALLMFRRRRDS